MDFNCATNCSKETKNCKTKSLIDNIEKIYNKKQIDSIKTDNLVDKKNLLNNQLNNDWIDIIGNGGLCQKIIRKGCGKLPKVGDWVLIQYKDLLNLNENNLNQKYFVLGFYFVIEGKKKKNKPFKLLIN